MCPLEGARGVGGLQDRGQDQGDCPDAGGDEELHSNAGFQAQAETEGHDRDDEQNGLHDVAGHGTLAQRDEGVEHRGHRVMQALGGQRDHSQDAWAGDGAEALVEGDEDGAKALAELADAEQAPRDADEDDDGHGQPRPGEQRATVCVDVNEDTSSVQYGGVRIGR